MLRAAEVRGLRDHALIRLMLASGLRISETWALDVDDVELSERKAMVYVRAGKGDTPRDVPMVARTAINVMNQWVRERRDHYGMSAADGPLFVTTTGRRLPARSGTWCTGRVRPRASTSSPTGYGTRSAGA